ncbi:MAG: hypothetical protein HY322_01000 [Betaproteobacteria bacterium]|nr:hypothetical protein [Betaproteobacteria bacterium]
MMPIFARSLLLMCFLAVLPAHAAEVVAPDVLAKNVTEEVLAILRADRDIQAGDSGKAAELIETKILPHFNFPAANRARQPVIAHHGRRSGGPAFSRSHLACKQANIGHNERRQIIHGDLQH